MHRGARAGEPATDVLPHEQTLPKPRSDRLDLLRATRANLSPIWGLSLAAGPHGHASTRPGRRPATPTTTTGSATELWVVDDPACVEAVGAGGGVGARWWWPTGTTATRRPAPTSARCARPTATTGAHDLVMALVVELAEDQLTVGPIHRDVAGLPAGTDLPAAFGRWFDVVRAGAGHRAGRRGARRLRLARPGARRRAPGCSRPRPEAYEAAGSDLDSSLVDLALAELPPHEPRTGTRWQEALVGRASSGEAQAAVLLRPVTVAQIAEWAGGPAAHAAEDHLLQPQAPHRDGLPAA